MALLDKLLHRLLPIICVGVMGNLAYAWFTTDISELQMPRFSVVWMLVAMLLALLPWGWHTLRLAIWGRFFGVSIDWKQLLRIAIATDVGAIVMPAAVGGAPLKGSMLVKHGYPPGQAATLTLWGSLEDVFFYAFAIPVSLCLTRNWNNPLWLSAGHFIKIHQLEITAGLIGLLAVFLLLFVFFRKRTASSGWWKKLSCVLIESLSAFSMIFSKGRQPFLWSLIAMAAQWITRYCVLLAVVQMLGLEAAWTKLLLLQWMVYVVMLLTPTPGAIGGAEAAFLLVFAGSLPDGTASMVLLVWRLLTYYFMLGIGAVYLAISTG
jgi:uncharacterized protein (TIRG00374 family)